jgi:hypothetical protein
VIHSFWVSELGGELDKLPDGVGGRIESQAFGPELVNATLSEEEPPASLSN